MEHQELRYQLNGCAARKSGARISGNPVSLIAYFIAQMNQSLHDAIANLYAVFARYPLNPQIPGSPLYEDLAQRNRMLASKPLRELGAADLGAFSWDALLTWGTSEDFKHFLPRTFELLTVFPDELEAWVTLDKLRYDDWLTWPEQERATVEAYLLALWQELLVSEAGKAVEVFEDYLAAIANVYPDFSTMLKLWEETDSPVAVTRLIELLWNHSVDILDKRILPGFHPSKEKGRVFYEWLVAGDWPLKIEASFFSAPDEETARRASAVLQMLEVCQR